MRRVVALGAALALAGCGSNERGGKHPDPSVISTPASAAASPASAPSSQPASTPPSRNEGVAGERSFGAGLKLAGPPIDVAQVIAHPEPHLGKVVQCEGLVSRVCERAGCWLELRAEGERQAGLRVPMAGHAFFIPQDAIGRRAVVEGALTARELSPEALQHLQSEGLAAIGPLSLAATAVVVR